MTTHASVLEAERHIQYAFRWAFWDAVEVREYIPALRAFQIEAAHTAAGLRFRGYVGIRSRAAAWWCPNVLLPDVWVSGSGHEAHVKALMNAWFTGRETILAKW